MINNRVTNIFISDGTALPANNGAISAVTAGKIGVFGRDMTALDPAGGDTITTQPYIHLVECNTDTSSVDQVKMSPAIYHANVTSYSAKSYTPAKREVWAVGYDRKLATGAIEVANSTDYTLTINFKHDKQLGSNRPIVFSINFRSAAAATQSSIADQIATAINNSPAFKKYITAVKVGNGTGVYGRTAATNFGVEITAKDIDQYTGTNYNNIRVVFSVQVDDSTGFGTTTTCTQIQANDPGVGTYEQVRILEDKALSYEGVLNRTSWPIYALDYSSSSSLTLSAAIGVNVAGTISEDTVTFAGSVAAILRAGEKVEINSVNYEIKYFISTTVAVLTTTVVATFAAADVCKVRTKYDIVQIEFDDYINTPGSGAVAVANKAVIIAVPALDAGDAYNGVSAAGQDIMDILNPWMLGAPGKFANISI
jgi:hypothetical protein